MRCNKVRAVSKLVVRLQLIEQGLGLLQIERVEAFGEPAVDRSKKLAGLPPFVPIAPQPRQAHRRAQFWGNGFSAQFIQQRFGPPKDRHVEALGEPAIDGTEQVTGFNIPSLIVPEEGETCRGSEVA